MRHQSGLYAWLALIRVMRRQACAVRAAAVQLASGVAQSGDR